MHNFVYLPILIFAGLILGCSDTGPEDLMAEARAAARGKAELRAYRYLGAPAREHTRRAPREGHRPPRREGEQHHAVEERRQRGAHRPRARGPSTGTRARHGPRRRHLLPE